MTITINLETELPVGVYLELFGDRGLGLMIQNPVNVDDTIYEFPVWRLPEGEEVIFRSAKFGDIAFDNNVSDYAKRNRVFTSFDRFVMETEDEPIGAYDYKLIERDGKLYSTVKCIRPYLGNRVGITVPTIPDDITLTIVRENGAEEVIPEGELSNVIPLYQSS